MTSSIGRMPSMSNEGSSSRYPLIRWKGAAVLDIGTVLNLISTKPTFLPNRLIAISPGQTARRIPVDGSSAPGAGIS